MNKAGLVLLSALLAWPASAKLGAEARPMEEWKGSFCKQAQPEVIVARTPQDWAKVWEKIGKPAPEADFKAQVGVAVFGGQRPTGGYSVVWQQEGSTIRYRWAKPKGMAMQVVTQPYDVRLFPATKEAVKVEALPAE